MKGLLILLLAGISAPALAQHAGHSAPTPQADPHAGHARPVPAQPDPHAGHARPVPAQPDPHAGHAMPAPAQADPHAGHVQPAPAQADPHAGHRMPAQPAPAQPPADPHAGHAMPAQTAPVPHAGHTMPAVQPDPHAGHAAPAAQAADPHAGHNMAAEPAAPPALPPSPAARSGPAHAADAVYGAAPMAAAREAMHEEHGAMKTSKILVDQAEVRVREGRDGYAWDAQGWYGGDIDKFWVKSEGEGAFGEAVEKVEMQALWSHAIDPWFDLQLGLRHDFRPHPERTYLVAGVQGLAPYWFEIDAAAFVSDEGDVSARVEAEYDLRITQKLILQPRAEMELALQDVPELGIGAGISSGEIGARLRYEIRPEFAPYVGVEYERSFGDTARFARAAGEKAGSWNLLIGVRTWF